MTDATPAGDLDDALDDFVHRWAEAIVANDVTRMARFVTDDWVLVDRPGLATRDQFHAVVASGELHHDTMSHEVIQVRRLSPDVALLVTRGHNSGSYRGQPISADEWTTDVVVRAADGWRCTLTQLTPLGAVTPADD